MKRWTWGFCAGLGVLAACKDDELATIQVQAQLLSAETVEENDTEVLRRCWVALASSSEFDAIVGRAVGDLCTGDPTAGGELVGGKDRIRVLVDYDDLDIEDSDPPPDPTIEWAVDGEPVMVTSSVVRADGGPGRRVYLVSFLVPARTGSAAYLTVRAAAGLEQRGLGPFRVEAPRVRVESCAFAPSCSAPAGVGKQAVEVRAVGSLATKGTLNWTIDSIRQQESAEIDLKPAPNSLNELVGTAFVPRPVKAGTWVITAQVGDHSGEGQAITLDPNRVQAAFTGCRDQPSLGGGEAGAGATLPTCVAGVGDATVRVTAAGDVAATARVTTSLDGVPLAGSFDVLLEPDSEGQLAGDAVVPVPPVTGRWSIQASLGNAKGKTSEILLTRNKPSIRIQGCPTDGACQGVAGVGDAAVEVTAAGAQARDATIRWFIGGIQQPSHVDLQLEPQEGGKLFGVAYVPVPAVRGGSSWSLVAELDGASSTRFEQQLSQPAITLRLLGCPVGGLCSLPAKTETAFVVTAPAGIREATATVLAQEGSLLTPAVTLPLSQSDIATETVSGSFPTVVPEKPSSTWTINARVAGYAAPTIVVNIVP